MPRVYRMWPLLLAFVLISVVSAIILPLLMADLVQGLVVAFTALSLAAWYFFWVELVLTSKFPRSEWKWVAFWNLATIIALNAELFLSVYGTYAAFILGLFGFAFMAYVNLRFGAPLVFDYALPFPYIFLLAVSYIRSTEVSFETGLALAFVVYVLLVAAQFMRTIRVGKLERLKARLG